ncbi:siderophore-interacting protein [Cryobacterium sp. PH29-G1]|uniref:siderophore-interacting protein n=1 Tax=Cryobacterium sp. PH29-G1 TaxID=3046211 RepID=UPI0024BB57EC|nr:siderophore-interacting protein [Cryobacterium sp. PH29-G1]MDJ0350787.1 siderophore-interacting protein [Cryobacterium sp. PH29-G1]
MNPTDFATRELIRHPLVRRLLEVAAVRDLSPTLRRITLVGADLAGFTATGPDDHIKIFFPLGQHPGGNPSGRPGQQSGAQSGAQSGTQSGAQSGDQPGTQRDDQPGAQSGQQSGAQSGTQRGDQPGTQRGDQSGTQSGQQSGAQSGTQRDDQPGTQRGDQPGTQRDDQPGTQRETAARDFTPREYRPAADGSGGELDIDFVLHADAAPATGWASRAAIGDTIEIGGPRGSRLVPAGIRSALLIADATALPATARWLQALPAEVAVTVVIAGGDVASGNVAIADLVAYLADGLPADAPGDEPTDKPGDWAADLHREHPATSIHVVDDHALLDTVRAQAIDDGTFVWAAGEARLLIAVRRHLRSERGLGRDQAQLSGYWKRGIDNLDHHAPLDPLDPED